VRAGEPALLELFEGRDAIRGLPDRGCKWAAVFVEGEGLEGVGDVGAYLCVDEGEFASRPGGENTEAGNAELA